ncbi:hypothetical protein ABPG74_016604 [Tetrahymena malaccensis]
MSFSDKVILQIEFQKIASQTLLIGQLQKNALVNINYDDLVSWQDKQPYRYSVNQTKANFLAANDNVLGDYCNTYHLCGFDQDCQSNFDNYLNQIDPNRIYAQYEKSQFSTWSNPNQNIWENLPNETKEKIIKVDLQRVFSITFMSNQQQNIIQTTSIYIVHDDDGMLQDSYMGRKLLAQPLLNNTFYGGPFTCNKVNNNYPKYAFTSADQFDGFLYKDYKLKTCGNKTNPCSCPYYNIKRLFPIDWRCRQWYIDSNKTFSAQIKQQFLKLNKLVFNLKRYFQEPGVDITLGELDSTFVYKIVFPNSNRTLNSMQDDLNYQQDAVVAIDISLGGLQNKFMMNTQFEYSYLVTSQVSDNKNNRIVIAHPQMNRFIDAQYILDVEFKNSTNNQTEREEYIQQTQFMSQYIEYEDNCLFNNTKYYQRIIYKNQTGYTNIFQSINVCVGNFKEQKSYAVAYYSKAFSLDKLNYDIQKLLQGIAQFVSVILGLVLALFFLITIVLLTLLHNFLKFNFNKPIQIVSKFINKSDNQNIYQFYKMVQQGKLKTQYELKNLISAINQVVLNIQQIVFQEFVKSQNYVNFQEIEQKYQQQLSIFQILQHDQGISMCLNNLAIINLHQRKFVTALNYMNQSHQISVNVLQCYFKNESFKMGSCNQQELYKQMSLDSDYRNYLKMLANKKYQLANLLYLNCKHQQNRTNYQYQGFQQFSNYQNDLEQINRQDSIKKDYIENQANISLSIVCANDSKQLNKLEDVSWINSSFYFSQKFQIKHKSNYDLNLENLKNNNKLLITQAIDLIEEAINIYFINQQSCQCKADDQNIYICLCYLLLIKCRMLTPGRNFIIRKNQKALISCLKSLNYELFPYDNQNEYKKYDKITYFDVSQINVNISQFQEYKVNKYENELQFFEVLYQDPHGQSK